MPSPPFEEQGDSLITPREAAEIFGVNSATVGVWARQGLLPFTTTLGGRRRYSRSVVYDLLRKKTGAPICEEEKQKEVDLVFGITYGRTHRILTRHGVVRSR